MNYFPLLKSVFESGKFKSDGSLHPIFYRSWVQFLFQNFQNFNLEVVTVTHSHVVRLGLWGHGQKRIWLEVKRGVVHENMLQATMSETPFTYFPYGPIFAYVFICGENFIIVPFASRNFWSWKIEPLDHSLTALIHQNHFSSENDFISAVHQAL